MLEIFDTEPSIYDLASFSVIVLLLCVIFGIHFRQMRHARSIDRLVKFTGVEGTEDKRS